MPIDTKVWARLPIDQYVYFFRKIYAGDKGLKQELVARFFTALYKECRRRGLKPEWSPDSATEINKMLANLNFNERRRTADTPSKHTKKSNVIADDAGAVASIGNQTTHEAS